MKAKSTLDIELEKTLKKLDNDRHKMILLKLEQMPPSFQRAYLKALRNPQNRKNRVKAFCAECCGYDRDGVKNCVCTGCVFWDDRPYKHEWEEST